VFGAFNRFPDRMHQTLVFPAMFRKTREAIPFEQTLLAIKVHASELDQPSQLHMDLLTIDAPHQLYSQLIQRIHEDPVLVIHRLYSHGAGMIPCKAAHKNLRRMHDCSSTSGVKQ
jgi:hypothetical protein